MKNVFFALVFLVVASVSVFSATRTPGERDLSFMDGIGGFNNAVLAIAEQPDGKIIVGGDFTMYDRSIPVGRICRLNADGTLDMTFNWAQLGFNDYILSIALQPDGKILVAGYFTQYNDATCSRGLVRLNSDGSIDNTFNTGGAGCSFSAYQVQVLSSGKILLAGDFTTYNGADCPDNFIRLNSNGTLDASFNSGGLGTNGYPKMFRVLSDGKILIAGVIYTYNVTSCPKGVIRINENGTYDNTFNSGGTGTTGDNSLCLDVASDGKILLGGKFTQYNSVDCSRGLIRLNADGTLDNTFNTGGTGFSASNYIHSVLIDGDNNILVGGFFNSYNGVPGQFGICRLTPDGLIDNRFNLGGVGFNNNPSVLLHTSNSEIFVVGGFDKYNNIEANRIIKLYNPVMPKITFNNVTGITSTGASSSVTITNYGGSEISEYGVCYNTSNNPTINNSKQSTTGSFLSGTYLATITGLIPGTTYYMRAFATNSIGTTYGTEYSFTTIPTLPEWGLMAMISLIAVAGGWFVWRKN